MQSVFCQLHKLQGISAIVEETSPSQQKRGCLFNGGTSLNTEAEDAVGCDQVATSPTPTPPLPLLSSTLSFALPGKSATLASRRCTAHRCGIAPTRHMGLALSWRH